MRVGDRVRAKQGSVAHLFSEGTVGVIAELRHPNPRLSCEAGGNNLIRWEDGDGIILGFRPNEVYKLTAEN